MSKLVAAGVGEFGATSAVSSGLPLTPAMFIRVYGVRRFRKVIN